MDNDLEQLKFTHEDGWLDWQYCAPCLDAPVQIQRQEWDRAYVVYRKELNPETHIAGLYWKPTGIYRELQASTPREIYQQMNAINSISCGMYGVLGGLLGGFGTTQATS